MLSHRTGIILLVKLAILGLQENGFSGTCTDAILATFALLLCRIVLEHRSRTYYRGNFAAFQAAGLVSHWEHVSYGSTTYL